MKEEVTIGRVLEFAITTEDLGHDLYRRLAERYSEDTELRRLFSRLAEDESLHASQLAKMRSDLEAGEVEELSGEDAEYLRSVSSSEVFWDGEDPMAVAEGVEDRNDALQVAHDLEKSTILYYQSLQGVIGRHEILERILEMEHDHLSQVVKYMMIPGAKMRGVTDQWP